jgi:hypothetical protein
MSGHDVPLVVPDAHVMMTLGADLPVQTGREEWTV